MSGKKKHRTANDYLQYLKGDFSNRERHLFERDLEADPFAKEAMEGLESLATDQAENDILSLHSRLRKRQGKKRRIAWYSVAASIASLLIIGTVFMQIYDFNPKVPEKTLNEEGFMPDRLEEPENESPEKLRDEMINTDELTTGEVPQETKDEKRLVPLDKTGGRSAKGSAKGPSNEPSMGPTIEEPDPITFMEADVVKQKEEAQFEYMVSEDIDAPTEGAMDEEMVEEMAEEETGRRAKRRAERASQPAAVPSAATQKTALSQEHYAQPNSRQLLGVVISGEDQEPIPGASVNVKGSNTGVVTNMDGTFILPLQDDSKRTIVARFVGMETQEYQFEDESNIQLVMQPDILALDEVVLVDQGIQPSAVPAGDDSAAMRDEKENTRSGTAQPSDGFEAFKLYIKENIQFPEAESSADRVVVVLRFTVKPSGELSDFIALRSPGQPFTQEATRLVLDGPSWNPAFNYNGSIEETVRLRIVFKK